MKLFLALVAIVATTSAVRAQQPVAAPPAPPAAAAPAAAASVAPDPFVYEVDGRRDPFVNLLGGGSEPPPVQRGDGAAGLTLSEISVRGVMQSRGALLAMIQSPDNKTYVLHAGDKLADGIVKSVTPQGLIVLQDVHDPLSIQKHREVRKLLRSLEAIKE